ncbi:MAG: N-6 DNA methylase, partial [Parafilimonas sp.]
TQAFGYKHKHKNCTYVITSNFEKLRFYINDATEYEEFDLFNLTQQRFALLYLCLQQQNLLSNLPLQIKQQSLLQEENITKKLYADYSAFKRKLFQNIADTNPQYDKLLLFKKTQKLLDRFLFIFFAEDRLLLPPNSVREILKQWEQLKELDNYVPLYERFKKYFGYLNVGHVGKQYEIFAYNGGLFLPDEILDNIIIDDAILYEGTKQLSNYDFETDVDVNILGHIFEHSLTEIEELQAMLEGKAIEKNTTKRKKDGVFYTPRYITKYIVENTVGALCTKQKEMLQINEESFAPQKRKANRKVLLDTIETYRNWLLQLTICDPACGSGAFLNAALEYLKEEHKTIDELKARIFGDAIVYTNIDNEILENNLFGVDINEEAIEIAKLSLWLHTAKKGRKLSNLSNNIKCGNSLIDDAAVAGDKAFVWKDEFKTVFDNGGFDVVIGNPPYVRPRSLTASQLDYLKNNFTVAENQVDLYQLFIEICNKLISKQAYFSLIVPNAFLANENSQKLRRFILSHYFIDSFVECKKQVFQEAEVESVVFVFTKEKKLDTSKYFELEEKEIQFKNFFDPSAFNSNKNNNFIATLDKSSKLIFDKIKIASKSLELYFDITTGIKEYQVGKGNPEQTQEDKDGLKFNLKYKKDETFKPELRGKNIFRYGIKWKDEYVSYGDWIAEPRNPIFFEGEKLLLRQIPGKHSLLVGYTDDFFIVDQSAFIAKKKLSSLLHSKYALTILNSKLIYWFFKNENNEFDELFPKIKSKEFKALPILEINEEQQQPFIVKADIMLSKNKELNQIAQQFTQLLQANLSGANKNLPLQELNAPDRFTSTLNINNKLQNWHTLNDAEFLKELSKQKIKLS